MIATWVLSAVAAASRASFTERAANMTIEAALQAVKPEAVALFQENTKDQSFLGMQNLDRATEILNGMFIDTETELDQLNAENFDLVYKKFRELSYAQAELSAGQASLTDAISRLSDALAQQKQSQESIESVTIQLTEVTQTCHEEVDRLEQSLRMLRGDLNVTGNIVQMVKCEKTVLMQCIYLDQVDAKGKKHSVGYYTFDHKDATEAMSHLQTKFGRSNVQKALERVYDGDGPALFQTHSLRHRRKKHARTFRHKKSMHTFRHQKSMMKRALKTSPNADPNQVSGGSSPPKAKTGRSGSDKSVAAATEPIQPSKQKSKCSLSRSKNCNKFLDQIMMMQGNIQDEVTNLEDQLHQLETKCEEERTSFSQQVTDSEKVLAEAQTEISHSTMEKTQYTETTRLLDIQIERLRNFIHDTFTKWHQKQKELEDTMCGVKKIRTEMYKFQGQDLLPQDCEVGDWTQNECSASCDGGKREEKREIIAPPKNKGAACPALEAWKDCNVQPCPQDCQIGEWEGWSACSAECGGGVQQRNRGIIQDAKFGGEACGETQQTQTCNSENCDEDCELSDFLPWTPCSKACGTGFQRRKRVELKSARGAGVCPPPGLKKRQLQRCNMNYCAWDVECTSKVDVMFLIDGSGSMEEDGFSATKAFVAELVKRFQTKGKNGARVGAIQFSGPGTWPNWFKCEAGLGNDEECGLQVVSPLTDDMEKLSAAIAGMEWIGATTNTAGALASAGVELTLGREDASSVVFVITDGDPNFKIKAGAAAHALRKSARLIFVPIGQYVDINNLKHWSSKPVRENIIPAWDAYSLEGMTPDFVSAICPELYSKSDEEAENMDGGWEEAGADEDLQEG